MMYTVYMAHSKGEIGKFLSGDLDACCLTLHGLHEDDVETFFRLSCDYNNFVIAAIPEDYDEDEEEEGEE